MHQSVISPAALVAALMFLCVNPMWAAEPALNQEKAGTEILQAPSSGEAASDDRVDQVITNRMLRAQTGSLSKWSVTTAIGYSAGSVAKPFDPIRPNITASNQNSTSLQNLGGSVGVKYRSSEMSSVTVNGGIRMLTPFQSSYSTTDPQAQKSFDENHGRFDFNNPAFAYGYIFSGLGGQNFFSIQQTLTTDTGLRQLGYLTNMSVYHAYVYDIPEARVSLTWRWNLTYYYFDKVATVDPAKQTIYQVGFNPAVDFNLNDRFNLRTEWSFAYEHTRERSSALSFRANRIAQTVGLGISLSRDVMLYPNVQFLPDDIRADRTNVGISTNINLF